MKYVYGPVPSRRLGRSLGIDPIPLKTCNWNCVYCQLGRTSPLVAERREYFPSSEILAEVGKALQGHVPGEIDWLTFVGSGEPTLHAGLGYMLRELKRCTSLPLAVITNGSFLYLPEVREELLVADAVLPSVDAGSDYLYRKINRPMAELDFTRFIDGIVAFRNEYQGNLWVEVMLVRGLNDTERALHDLASVLEWIRPDEVHLNSPTRAPCEPWVKPVDDNAMAQALRILGTVARVVRPRDGEFDLSGSDDVMDAVAAIVRRHPLSETELVTLLQKWTPGHVRDVLEKLAQSGKATVVIRDGLRHWTSTDARYVPEASARCQLRPSPEEGVLP